MMEGEKMDSRKKILKLRYFSHLKILTSAFYLQRHLELFFFLPLFQCFSLSLLMLCLFEDLGILMINEEKTLFKNLFSNEMEWLSHGYGNGGFVDISAVDAYFGMELCTPILFGEASKKMDGKSFSKKFKTHNGHIP
jgi:hypothetical protein